MEKEDQGKKDECSGNPFFIHGRPPSRLPLESLGVLFFSCLFRLCAVFLEPGPEIELGDPPFFHESLLSVIGVAEQSNGQEFPLSRRAHPPAMKLGTETCHHEMMISPATGQRQGLKSPQSGALSPCRPQAKELGKARTSCCLSIRMVKDLLTGQLIFL
jgi:hypothetical protein